MQVNAHHSSILTPRPPREEQPTGKEEKEEAATDTKEFAKEVYAQQIELEKQRCHTQRIKSIMEIAGSNLFYIEREKVEQIQKSLCIGIDELLATLVSAAKPSALPAISKYHVGAAGLGKSGNIYLGVNIEFESPLNQAIHGEQCLAANLRYHKEEKLVKLAVSAAPCGHCRQFLYELDTAMEGLIVLIPGTEPKTLGKLLPFPFGPKDLGKESGFLQFTEITSSHENPLIAKAIEAAASSYAAHTEAKSGVAIRTKDGQIYQGYYLENAAYNPSLSPLQTAIAVLVTAGNSYDDIEEIVLVELEKAKFSHLRYMQPLVEEIAPHAKFTALKMADFS